jgi:hypothetical protein
MTLMASNLGQRSRFTSPGSCFVQSNPTQPVLQRVHIDWHKGPSRTYAWWQLTGKFCGGGSCWSPSRAWSIERTHRMIWIRGSSQDYWPGQFLLQFPSNGEGLQLERTNAVFGLMDKVGLSGIRWGYSIFYSVCLGVDFQYYEWARPTLLSILISKRVVILNILY